MAVLLGSLGRVSARRLRDRDRDRNSAAAVGTSRARVHGVVRRNARLGSAARAPNCRSRSARPRIARRAAVSDPVLPRRLRRARRRDGGGEPARLRAGVARLHSREGAGAGVFRPSRYSDAGTDRRSSARAQYGPERAVRGVARADCVGACARRHCRGHVLLGPIQFRGFALRFAEDRVCISRARDGRRCSCKSRARASS